MKSENPGRSRYLSFLLWLVTGAALIWLANLYFYIHKFGDDFLGKNLATSDIVNVCLSGSLSSLHLILVYALFLAIVYSTARWKTSKLNIKITCLFLLAALTGFYIRAVVVPQITLKHYAIHWAILEEGDKSDGELIYAYDYFKGSANTSSCTEISIIADSLEIQLDSARSRQINNIKYIASPAHIERLLSEPEFENLFSKYDFEGITDKGHESWTDPQVEENVRILMENAKQENDLRGDLIMRYRNEKNKMIFFPFHLFCFCLIAFFTGTLLRHVYPWLLFMISVLVLSPFVVSMFVVFSTRLDKGISPVAPWQLRQLVFELVLMGILGWLSVRSTAKENQRSEI